MQLDDGTLHWLLHTAAIEITYHESTKNTRDMLIEMEFTSQEADELLRTHKNEIERLAKELQYWQHGTRHPDFDAGTEFRLIR